MPKNVDYVTEAFGEPTPKQDEFYAAKTRYVGMGGARGGGKSHSVRLKASLLADRYPGIKMLIIRKTLKDLRRNYVRPLKAAYMKFPPELRPDFKEQEMCFWYQNGSMLEMGYCDTDADADNYRGSEWDVIFIDEGTELSEYQYGIIVSCARGVNEFPKRVYVTCNPGGQGHANIKRLFITREYRRSEDPEDYTFIRSYVWDNIPLMMADQGFIKAWKRYRKENNIKDPMPTPENIKELMYFSDYVKVLDNLPAKIREAHLNGDWDIFSGQFFPEFSEDVHVKTEAEIVDGLRAEGYKERCLPRYWRRSASIDYGLDRFAALWYAVDERGQAYCYRNFEAPNLNVTEAVTMFKELSRFPDGTNENIDAVVAPPDLWNRRNDTGRSAAEIFYNNGVPLIPAGRERVAGWLFVKEYLRYERAASDEKQFAVKSPPKMIFLDCCTWIIKYLPLLQFDIKKPSDVATEPHDITHSPDALRAWCSLHQAGTIIPPVPKVYNFESEKPKAEGWGGEVTEEYLTGGYGN
jgi:phage terminase large subunit